MYFKIKTVKETKLVHDRLYFFYVPALFPFMYYFFRLFNISPMNNGSQAFFYMAVSSAIKERTKENKVSVTFVEQIFFFWEHFWWHI